MAFGELISIKLYEDFRYDKKDDEAFLTFLKKYPAPYCVLSMRDECSGDGYDRFLTLVGFHKELYASDYDIEFIADPESNPSITALVREAIPVNSELDRLSNGLSLIRNSIKNPFIIDTITEKIAELTDELNTKESVILDALSKLDMEDLKYRQDALLEQQRKAQDDLIKARKLAFPFLPPFNISFIDN